MNDADYLRRLENMVLDAHCYGWVEFASDGRIASDSDVDQLERLCEEVIRRRHRQEHKPELKCDIFNPLGKDVDFI